MKTSCIIAGCLVGVYPQDFQLNHLDEQIFIIPSNVPRTGLLIDDGLVVSSLETITLKVHNDFHWEYSGNLSWAKLMKICSRIRKEKND